MNNRFKLILLWLTAYTAGPMILTDDPKWLFGALLAGISGYFLGDLWAELPPPKVKDDTHWPRIGGEF